MSSPERPAPTYFVAVAVLVALLLAAGGLLIAMAMRPSVSPAAIEVRTSVVPTDCLVQKRNTTCFDSQATNTGSEGGQFDCRVVAFGETEATFASGDPAIQITLNGHQTLTLTTEVKVHGNGAAAPPRVQCDATRPA